MLVIQRPTVEAAGEAEGNRQQFTVGPLEPGFGYTIGNSLRRTLLSSIPGAAITTVRFDDALHEFDTIAGVAEDVTDIILNLKDIVLTSSSEEPVVIRLDIRGPADVAAGDIKLPPEIEILNRDAPHRHRQRQGPAGRRPHGRAGPGLPVRRPGVAGPHHRRRPHRRHLLAGPPRDLHRRAHPGRAVDELRPPASSTSRPTAPSRPRRRWPRPAPPCARWSTSSPTCRDEPQGLELGEVAAVSAGSPDLDLAIEDLDLSERPRNCLKRAQINTIGELLTKTEDDLLNITNFGQKSPRRGEGQARRARSVARGAEDEPTCRNPTPVPSLRRLGLAPAADDGQPGRVAVRRRGHRHHRGQGQGPAPRRREADHQGQEGADDDRCRSTDPPDPVATSATRR